METTRAAEAGLGSMSRPNVGRSFQADVDVEGLCSDRECDALSKLKGIGPLFHDPSASLTIPFMTGELIGIFGCPYLPQSD
jgi:hypothetical protein